MRFQEYLINEEKSHLGHRVGDVLTGVQELQKDMEGMGSRHLARLTDQLVDELRKIIHGSWTDQQNKYLKPIQRVAVALKKALEERDDLKEILPVVAQELQGVVGKLGVRINDLKAPEEQGGDGEEIKQSDFEDTPPDQPQQQPQQPQQGEDPAGADAGGANAGMPGPTMGAGL